MIKRNPVLETRWPLRVIDSGRVTAKQDKDDSQANPSQPAKKLRLVDRRERAKPPGLY